MRLGILGGAFNPPHIGHMVCAQEALVQFELDRVLLMPMGIAPHRKIEPEPGADARFEMCERAAADDARLIVSRVEVDQQTAAYTVDTLRAIAAGEPDDELFLILGGDQASSLPSWREPEQVLELATVAVAARSGWSRDAVGVTISGLRGGHAMRYFDMPRIDVSSTMVRRRVAEGKPIRYLVPDGVMAYIAENGLYAAPAPVGAE